MKTWKVDDVVLFTGGGSGGGPGMVVTAVATIPTDPSATMVSCQWFNKTDELQTGNFSPGALVPASASNARGK